MYSRPFHFVLSLFPSFFVFLSLNSHNPSRKKKKSFSAQNCWNPPHPPLAYVDTPSQQVKLLLHSCDLLLDFDHLIRLASARSKCFKETEWANGKERESEREKIIARSRLVDPVGRRRPRRSPAFNHYTTVMLADCSRHLWDVFQPCVSPDHLSLQLRSIFHSKFLKKEQCPRCFKVVRVIVVCGCVYDRIISFGPIFKVCPCVCALLAEWKANTILLVYLFSFFPWRQSTTKKKKEML